MRYRITKLISITCKIPKNNSLFLTSGLIQQYINKNAGSNDILVTKNNITRRLK
jgi:hypothetical protein